MKVALVGGGQPRFTKEFSVLMKQLSGFDKADFYFNFWTSSWVKDESEARQRIESVLEPKYSLAEIRIIDQPSYELPPHQKYHEPEAYPNTHWAYKRRLGMWLSVRLAFQLINEDYDVVLKIRPDGMLTNEVDLSKLDLVNNDLIFPNFPRNGYKGKEICDQFVIGTQSGIDFYSSLADMFGQYVPEVYPQWEDNIHYWASEHLLAHHLDKHSRQQIVGDYGVILAGQARSVTQGRSQFTDNHFHHPVVEGLI